MTTAQVEYLDEAGGAGPAVSLNQECPPASPIRQGLMPGRDKASEKTKRIQDRLRHRQEGECVIKRLPRGKTGRTDGWLAVGRGLSRMKGQPLVTLNIPWQDYITGIALTPIELWAMDVVVYLVIYSRLYNRRKGGRGFAPVAYAYIRLVVGEPGMRALDWLKRMGVVKCDELFVKGSKAYGFKLTPTAITWGYRVTPMPATVAARFNKHWAKRRREAVQAGSLYAHQWQTLRSVTLDPAIWPAVLNPPKGMNRVKAVHRILAACHIQNRNWYFSDDKRTGRCFTNASNFPSDLRRFLRIGGQATGECDIANSQPTLLVSLVYGKDESAERTLALNLVQAGKFYSTVCGWAGLGDLAPAKQKVRVFAGVLFAEDHSSSKLWPGVVAHLPKMADYINRAKSGGQKAALALRLQTLEADIMLKRAFPRLKGIGISALSLHDGCLVAVEHLQCVEAVVCEEVEAVTGIKPLVRIKIASAS